jgi:Kef-type K+ transport system membrane component KefB
MLFADADLAGAALALQKLHVEDLLLPVLIQLAVIIVAARLAGIAARKLGQPAVVGEIVAGLMLGPSLFGVLFPGAFAFVFSPHLPGVEDALTRAAFPKVFEVLKELGLIFLLFLIGLEFDFGHLKLKGRAAAAVCAAGVALPFALGAGLAPVIHGHLEPHEGTGLPVPLFALTLFLGTALSITALPVLGRVLVELGLTRTKLATVVITAAAVGDAVGWTLLASVAAVAKAEYDPLATAKMVGLVVAFFALMFFAARPVLVRYFRASLAKSDGELSLNAFVVLLTVLLLCATATSVIGVFAIFGAFILGAVLSDQEQFREAVSARLRDFVTAFFLPVFFTYTGLRTDVTSLSGATAWLVCGAVTAAALFGKIAGCGAAARLTGFSVKESAIIGVMMNTRGLMELIVINVGYDLGVIPKSLFCGLVLMAVLTNVMTTPLVLLLRHGTELEEPIRRSGFPGPAVETSPARGAERSAAAP